MNKLNIAIRAAKEAGKIHLEYFNDQNAFLQNKNPRDLVTRADIEAEKKIISILNENFPEYSILTEESGMHSRNSKYLWVIDPLDGTGNFFKGHRDFCVLISLVKDEETLFGVSWFPLTEELFVAQKGNGATKNGKPTRVSNESEMSKMYANTHMSSKIKIRKLNFKLYEKVLMNVRNVHVVNACIARTLCDIAEGIADFQFKEGFNYWDYSAGVLLVEESGGKATDLLGNPITIDSKNSLISNGKNHKTILEFLNS